MDQKTLCEQLSERLRLPGEDVAIMLHNLVGAIEEAALEQDAVAIPGFGTFETRKRLERVSVHPSTGKKMLYPPKQTISFRPSPLLKKQINES
ncbi:MAG: HU family DNA-binding protein [Bacteroides sp.]|nr:HU family DNA-binding protein [Bacteroides sp.]